MRISLFSDGDFLQGRVREGGRTQAALYLPKKVMMVVSSAGGAKQFAALSLVSTQEKEDASWGEGDLDWLGNSTGVLHAVLI
jgi:hypothetical protein